MAKMTNWQRFYLWVPVAAAILNQQDSVPVIFKYQTFVAGSPLLKGQQLFGNSIFKSFDKSHPRLKADISVLRTHALKKNHKFMILYNVQGANYEYTISFMSLICENSNIWHLVMSPIMTTVSTPFCWRVSCSLVAWNPSNPFFIKT